MSVSWLADKNRLLFIMSMCITVGGWLMTITTWRSALTTGAIGGLLMLLGNNVFANLIKNVGLFPTNQGGNGTSTPTTTNKP